MTIISAWNLNKLIFFNICFFKHGDNVFKWRFELYDIKGAASRYFESFLAS